MKFDYLREFAAAAEADELQSAARALGISPSVLSKHIKAIETELGVPLFTRTRRMELSPFGKILLPYARELTALQDEYLMDFSGSTTPPEHRINIGISAIQIRERSGQIIERYMLSHPESGINIIEAGNSELCDLVLEGKCDLAFIRTQSVLERNPDLIYMPFCVDEMVAFLPPEHPLARQSAIRFDQLQNDRFILRSVRSAIYRVCMTECEKYGFLPEVIFAAPYVTYDMVRRGEGVTFYLAPPSSEEYDTPLTIIPIRPPVYSFLDIVFRREHLTAGDVEFLNYVQQDLLAQNTAAGKSKIE